jgi:hypothetical protein
MSFFTVTTGEHAEVIIISLHEVKPTDREVNMLLDELKALLETTAESGNRLHLIYHIKVPVVLTLEQRHFIAEWIKENFKLIKLSVLSTAYVTVYGAHEIMIESLYFLQAPDWSVSFFKSLNEAKERAERKFVK